jgi:hypothetical protein
MPPQKPQNAPDTLPANFSGWDQAPDTLPADFAGFDKPDFAQNPPGVRRPVPQELQPGMTLTSQGAMPFKQAVQSGPLQPAGEAEQAMGFGRTIGESVRDAAKVNAEGATYALPAFLAPASLLGRMALTGGAAGANTAITGGSPKDVALSAGAGALLQGAGEKLPAFLSRFSPSAVKAGASTAFDAASQAVGSNPVNVEGAGQAVLSARELQDVGRTMPRTMQKFLTRVTDPSLGELTYDEARKFYSAASELSASEQSNLTPAMRRALNQYKNALGSAIQETANSGGVGQQYQQAMSDYARGAQLEDRFQKAWSVTKKAAITGAIGLVGGAAARKGYKLYSDVTEK